MPTNVSPEYKKAEAAYRAAREPAERLTHLREMLRTIPKHKGTEHLQGDIKSRIKDLTEELGVGRKAGTRTGPELVIHPEGAGQVALLGPPNCGKSALHERLTGAHSTVGPYPFTTQYPGPGMLEHRDASIQLVDLPAISPEHEVPWIANALQPADGSLLVIDLSHPGCLVEVVQLHDVLAGRKVSLTADWSGADGEDDDPFGVWMPTVIVATKADLIEEPEAELDVFRELTGYDYPTLIVSSVTGEGIDSIGPWLCDHLGVVRVYTKIPGQVIDEGKPYTVRRGQTVHDVALLVHRDIAASLNYARVWGEGSFDGQQVGRDHVVRDGDVIELHT